MTHLSRCSTPRAEDELNLPKQRRVVARQRTRNPRSHELIHDSILDERPEAQDLVRDGAALDTDLLLLGPGLHIGVPGDGEAVGDALGAELHGDVQVSVRVVVALAGVEEEGAGHIGLGAVLLELSEDFLEIPQAVWLVLWPDDVEACVYVVSDIGFMID